MIYDALKYVLEFFSSISETLSVIDWEIDVIHLLAPHSVYAHKNRPVSQKRGKMEFYEDADGIGARLQCTPATSEQPTALLVMLIGHNKWI
jgi:hypothetical protein